MLHKPRILVTGATGSTGLAVVHELLNRAFPVRALVHGIDARSDALARRGVEVVVADMFDPDQLRLALQGTQRAYFLPLFDRHMIQSAAAFAVAAREAGVEFVVQMSQWTSHRAHPSVMTRQTWLVDQLFSTIPGVAHTIFNPGMFAHNFLRTIDFAALLGIHPVLSGDGRAAPVSNEDMGRCVAVLLAEGPDRHAGRSYRPTGPQLLTGGEMAAIIGKVVGRRVRPINFPFWMLSKVARQQGIDPYQVANLRFYMEDMKAGTFAFEGGVTHVVEELTGIPAEPFEATAQRYAALPMARQTLANRARAFLRFNLTPFYRSTNFDRWERSMGLPRAPHPTLAIHDAQWRAAHQEQMSRKSDVPRSTPRRPALEPV